MSDHSLDHDAFELPSVDLSDGKSVSDQQFRELDDLSGSELETPHTPGEEPVEAMEELLETIYLEKEELYQHAVELVQFEESIFYHFLREEAARRGIFVECFSCSPMCARRHLHCSTEDSTRSATVNPLCLFSSIVSSEYANVVQEAVLRESELELREIFAFFRLESIHLGVYELLKHDESRRFNTILDYHRYAMKWASTWQAEEAAQAYCARHEIVYIPQSVPQPSNNTTELESTLPPPVETTTAMDEEEEEASGNRREMALVERKPDAPEAAGVIINYSERDAIQQRHNFMRTIIGQKDSPFCSYLHYLDVNILTTSEETDRRCILEEEHRLMEYMLYNFFNRDDNGLEEMVDIAVYEHQVLRGRETFERRQIEAMWAEEGKKVQQVVKDREARELEEEERLDERKAFSEDCFREHGERSEQLLHVLHSLVRDYLEQLDTLHVINEYNQSREKLDYLGRVKECLHGYLANLEREERDARVALEEDERCVLDGQRLLFTQMKSFMSGVLEPIQKEESLARRQMQLQHLEWMERQQIVAAEVGERADLYNPSLTSKGVLAQRSISRLSVSSSSKSADDAARRTAEVLSTNEITYQLVNDYKNFLNSDEIPLMFS
ncbi:hypothetical protein ADEAN_000640600 [Angomonas deanei]|uniref:Uncharacterized protein n=1 Tax=Angomonas deanei TaxID=59799 RepID=A0A7G2CJX2_9TRYP|nr:hypothetical protein ADEAN_000640600 [Angomonas deanei]